MIPFAFCSAIVDSIMAVPRIKWQLTNDDNSITLWEHWEDMNEGYAMMPTVWANEFGWVVQANGFQLLLRLAMATVHLDGNVKAWPHWEIYVGSEWNEGAMPIFIRCFRAGCVTQDMAISPPTVQVSTSMNGPTWLLTGSEICLGLTMTVCNN